jgi:hypothetical protein
LHINANANALPLSRILALAFSLSRARAFSASLAIRAKPIGKTHFLILVSGFFLLAAMNGFTRIGQW